MYWDNGSYVLTPARFDDVTTKIDDVRRILANSPSRPPTKANGASVTFPADDAGLAGAAAPKASKVPVLEQMNRDFAAGYIGSKFRVAKFDLHPRYPRQRHVEFLSKDDFINGVRHPMVRVPKFDKAGKPDGTNEATARRILAQLGPAAANLTLLPSNRARRRLLKSSATAVFTEPSTPIRAFPSCRIMSIARQSAPSISRMYTTTSLAVMKHFMSTSLDWMASGVQHPDDPGRSALSLRGVPGCGKGVFALGYGHLFGRHFLHATHRDHVIGRFNAHQAETCLIFVDEALYAEIAADAQILKTMTSETTKLLERKGIDAIQIDNYARQIFATNAEHPIQIEHNDRRYPAIYVRENEAFANETDEIVKAEKRKAYFMPIIDELKNGGSEALLGLLLDRDIHGFNAEAIPETAERRQQKLNSASGWRQDYHRVCDRRLPCLAHFQSDHGLREHTVSLGVTRHLQTLGLFDVMKAHGGPKLAHKSDTDLAKILKDWDFKSKPLSKSKAWEAPPLLDLRKAILTKYPAVEFDDRSEWVAADGSDDDAE